MASAPIGQEGELGAHLRDDCRVHLRAHDRLGARCTHEHLAERVDDHRVACVGELATFADEFWPLAPSTDCYVVVANWPAARREHWKALLRGRAIENQAYVVGVNRVGEGGRLAYAGDSMIVDPLGEVLAHAEDAEATLVADVDPKRIAAVREEFPFLQDRR